jgi:hypothetical protein
MAYAFNQCIPYACTSHCNVPQGFQWAMTEMQQLEVTHDTELVAVTARLELLEQSMAALKLQMSMQRWEMLNEHHLLHQQVQQQQLQLQLLQQQQQSPQQHDLQQQQEQHVVHHQVEQQLQMLHLQQPQQQQQQEQSWY